MLAVIAVLPQPPLLVPELAGGAAVDTEALRQACRDAAGELAGVSRWVAVGADAGGRRTVAPGTRGTFAGYGRDVRVTLAGDPDPAGSGAGGGSAPGGSILGGSAPGGSVPGGGPGGRDEGAALPLPLLVAAWAAGDRPSSLRGELVAPDAGTAECLALGAELAAEPGETALLVVGDGAARHGEKAPGGPDERAEAFDAVVADALDTADPAALAGLDPGLAGELWAAGRAPWQVLAGAARAGGTWTAGVRHTSVPYGVAYHVATWRRS